jgi:hypothetical protein
MKKELKEIERYLGKFKRFYHGRFQTLKGEKQQEEGRVKLDLLERTIRNSATDLENQIDVHIKALKGLKHQLDLVQNTDLSYLNFSTSEFTEDTEKIIQVETSLYSFSDYYTISSIKTKL